MKTGFTPIQLREYVALHLRANPEVERTELVKAGIRYCRRSKEIGSISYPSLRRNRVNPSMAITSQLFEAYVKCPTKCWLRYAGENAMGNAYATWVQAKNAAYRVERINRLVAEVPDAERVAESPTKNLKAARWRMAADVAARLDNLAHRVGRGTVANVLKRSGIEPSPERSSERHGRPTIEEAPRVVGFDCDPTTSSR